MRIVGGMWRGRTFDAPEGRGTRPTTDRMRESLASMILSALGLELEGVSVLDAFAGSGGVGLELLSRGVAHCTFCERNRKAASIITRNAKTLGAHTDQYAVICGDVSKIAERERVVGSPFDVVFLDPPYAMSVEDVVELVSNLTRSGALSDSCLIVYERATDHAQLALEGLELLKSKRHGGTSVDILQREKDHE